MAVRKRFWKIKKGQAYTFKLTKGQTIGPQRNFNLLMNITLSKQIIDLYNKSLFKLFLRNNKNYLFLWKITMIKMLF